MALVDNVWYVNYGDGSTTGYYAVTAWATGATIAAGALRRQLAAPAVGSERVFVCIVAGTTHASTEPTWVITRGGKTTDNTVTWQECTGIAALNGDATNTPTWTITATPPGGVKNTAVTLGQVIKRDNAASYQICTTAGTAGNGAEPSFSNTAGTTTSDNTVTWTSLGVVGNFTGWQAPHARIVSACTATWVQAGNSVFIGDNHAETQAAALTLNATSTAASPVNIYCVDRTVSVPPGSSNLKTTATISTTGNNAISIGSAATNQYLYGFTFNIGTGATNTNLNLGGGNNSSCLVLESCTLALVATGSNGVILLSSGAGINKIKLNNVVVNFSNAGQAFKGGVDEFTWSNTASAVAGTTPTTLFNAFNASGARLLFSGIDLSALGSGKTIVGTATGPCVTMVDCKLGASVTIAGTPAQRGTFVSVVRSDSAGTNYQVQRYTYEGSHVPETTIVRTGGGPRTARPRLVGR